MSAAFLDHFSSVAAAYADFRPNYPPALFEWLATLTADHDAVWDCACGNGQASRDLAKHYKRVIATDASKAQIDAAPADPGIEFRVAAAEDSGLPDKSVNLVTVATALHWFDFEKFYAEVKRVLKPKGVFAAWCYDYLVLENEKAEALVKRFYKETIFSYWPPERRYVHESYRTVPFPFEEIEAPAFTMHVSWTLPQLLGYLRTWSSVQAFKKAHGFYPVAELEKELVPAWGDRAAAQSIKLPLALRAGRI